MKRSIIVLVTFLIMGCGGESLDEAKSKTPSRIKLKEESYNGVGLYIVEIDSVEYLVNYHGGIIKLK